MARFAKNFMKLFGKMKIFDKTENDTSVCFRKTGHSERENMENEQLFSLCMLVKFLRGPLKPLRS